MNWVLKNGKVSDLPYNKALSPQVRYSEVCLPSDDTQVSKIELWTDVKDHGIYGFSLVDSAGEYVLAAGWCDDDDPSFRTFDLKPGERIIGVMGHFIRERSPTLFDPVFVIGRLD